MFKKILITVFLLLLSSRPAFAQDTKFSQVYTLAPSEIVNDDLFVAAENVNIEGTVNGDIYVAGKQVTISGNVTGDILAAGGTIDFSGNAGEDVRLAGGNITVSGKVRKNLSVASGNTTLTQNASVTGGVSALFGNLTIDSPISRYVKGAGGNLTLNNTIGGTVEAAAGSLNLGSSAVINGDLVYWSRQKAVISESAAVTGHTVFHAQENNSYQPERLKNRAVAGAKLSSFIFTLILGLIYLALFPRHLEKSVNKVKENTLIAFFIGFISPFVIILLVALFAVTIIGIPLAVFIFFAYLFIVYFARIPVIFFIGDYLNTRFVKQNKPVWSFIFGLLIYWIITMIPVVGGLFKAIAVTIGTGAFLLAFQSKKETAKSLSHSRKR